MFRRFSKSASRKGKTAYKFAFTFELANLTGVPANVDHAALTFARGAKTYTSSVAPVEECAAVWHDARSSRLEFVATLYKDSSGAFQTKQYALKAQGVTGAVHGATAAVQHQRRKTFAKSVLDLASFASLDGARLDADAELQYVPLESCTKGMPGTVAGMSVTCAWLRDAAPGEAQTADSNLPGSIRVGGGSEATELVLVGAAASESEPDAERLARDARAALDEQDLAGFAVEDNAANVTDEVFAFPDASTDASEVLGGADRKELTPVREGTPGRELASPDAPSPDLAIVGSASRDDSGVDERHVATDLDRTDRTDEPVPLVADRTQEVGAFEHEDRDERSERGGAPRSPATPVDGSDVSPDAFERAALSSEDKHTPARVLVSRAVAPLREEIDSLRASLAEAVTKLALAESDATEHAAHARAAREELRNGATMLAVAEERARALEAESSRLKAALLESEERRAAEKEETAAAEARAAEEALALSREAAEAAAAVERAAKESAGYRRELAKAEASLRKRTRAAGEKSVNGETLHGKDLDESDATARLEAARAKLSAAKAETAAATRAKEELRAECVTLRHALTQSELALKKADEAKEKAALERRRAAEASAAEEKARHKSAPLREMSEAETLAKQTSVMKKLLEKLRADLKRSEASAAEATKALSFEASARKDAEARAEEAAARANAVATPEPNRSCSLLW